MLESPLPFRLILYWKRLLIDKNRDNQHAYSDHNGSERQGFLYLSRAELKEKNIEMKKTIVLAVLAFGLLVNAAVYLPRPAFAQSYGGVGFGPLAPALSNCPAGVLNAVERGRKQHRALPALC